MKIVIDGTGLIWSKLVELLRGTAPERQQRPTRASPRSPAELATYIVEKGKPFLVVVD